MLSVLLLGPCLRCRTRGRAVYVDEYYIKAGIERCSFDPGLMILVGDEGDPLPRFPLKICRKACQWLDITSRSKCKKNDHASMEYFTLV